MSLTAKLCAFAPLFLLASCGTNKVSQVEPASAQHGGVSVVVPNAGDSRVATLASPVVAKVCTPVTARPPSCGGIDVRCDEDNPCASPLVSGCRDCTLTRQSDDDASLTRTFTATLTDFRLDEFEVTVGRFRKFVEAYPLSKPLPGSGANPGDPADKGWDDIWDKKLAVDREGLSKDLSCNVQGRTWTPKPGPNEAKPIGCLTWYEAFAFCIWDGGRLPTEMQWYYTAAGGTEARPYPWGSEAPNPNLAVYDFCDKRDWPCISSIAFAPVGSKPAGKGRWGQLDLAGSVSEWVRDVYAPQFPARDPCDNCIAFGPVQPSMEMRPVTSGGEWVSRDSLLTLAYRLNSFASSRRVGQGVRCVRQPE